MIKKIFLFVVLTAIFACNSVKEYNSKISGKEHSVKALQEDIDLTYTILKEGHPGLYWYINKIELDAKFDSLKMEITAPLTTASFYKKLLPVVAAIKCGHTTLVYPTLIIKDKKIRDSLKKNIAALNQFSYNIDSGKSIFITKNRDTNSFLKTGAELLEINNVKVENIIEEFRKNVSTDGFNTTFIDKKLEKIFPGMFRVYYPYTDSLLVKYKLENDSIGEIFIKTFKVVKKEDTLKKGTALKKVEPIQKEKLKSYAKYRGKKENGEYPIDFKYLTENKELALIKIKTFASSSSNYNSFFKECFDSLKLSKSTGLIIDLRDNGGGFLNASISLYAHLTDKKFQYLDRPVAAGYFNPGKYGKGLDKMMYFLTGHNDVDVVKQDKDGYYTRFSGSRMMEAKKNNFRGKVYVLTNGYTFSAASLLSANLRGINRATLIGTETGGGFNQCTAGTIPVIPLKNSELGLRFGLYKISPKFQTELKGRGVFPDVELTSTIKEKIKGVDRELQWVLDHHKNTR